MATPAVRPPPPPVIAPRPAPAPGQAMKFSELLGQRRPPAPPVEAVPDELPELVEAPASPLVARTAVTREDEEEDTPLEDEAPVTVTAVAPTTWVLPDAACAATAREVGLTVAGFCNDRAVNNGEMWSVQMALRADLVPDTTLHLSLSPHWLTLRFQAADPAALDLLSRGRETLEQVLENTLSRKRDIAITFDSP
ncbi:MAG: type III secretion system protein SctP [Rhizobacter sp.]